jgi:hypothetical protein
MFDVAAFRVLFPAFSSVTLYPDESILAASEAAKCMMDSHSCGCDTFGWQLMTAHILQNGRNISTGTAHGGQISSSTIDKVSVTMTTLTTRSAFDYWLSGTPYGLNLLALLAKCSSGGAYIGGSPERSAFRSVGGRFPSRGRVF